MLPALPRRSRLTRRSQALRELAHCFAQTAPVLASVRLVGRRRCVGSVECSLRDPPARATRVRSPCCQAGADTSPLAFAPADARWHLATHSALARHCCATAGQLLRASGKRFAAVVSVKNGWGPPAPADALSSS